jgi:phosphoribosylformylglycinamidine cyclo-ligase
MQNSWEQPPIGNIVTTSNFVGTKCLVAQWANQYEAIGADVININVNDLLAKNALPLAVSVSLSMLKDTKLEMMSTLGIGLQSACEKSNIRLINGEIAHLPEILQPEILGRTFNIIGFGIGIIHNYITKEPIKEGDLLIGLESNGIHCNGFALVRKTLIDKWLSIDKFKGFKLGDVFKPTGKKIEEELLRPTISYKSAVDVLKNERIEIKGMANVTNKGISCLWELMSLHNIGFQVDRFPNIPPIFTEVQKRGRVSIGEMFRVFNMGIGFYLIVSPDKEMDIIKTLERIDLHAYTVGKAIENSQIIKINFKNKEIVFNEPNKWDEKKKDTK